MPMRLDDTRRASAEAKFARIARVIDRVSADIKQEYGAKTRLAPQGRIRKTAANAYALDYSLRHPDDGQLWLTFMVVEDEADLLLIQGRDSGPPDLRTNPGQVDQRVYRLGEIEAIKAALKDKVVGHLRARGVLH